MLILEARPQSLDNGTSKSVTSRLLTTDYESLAGLFDAKEFLPCRLG